MNTYGGKSAKKAKQRERNKRHSTRLDRDEDGSRMNMDMVAQRLQLTTAKIRAEIKDPFTTHPMSFEEFDNIPDIGELEIKKKKI